MIYLYAITDGAGTRLPQSSLREVTTRGLAIVFTAEERPAAPAADALWAHEAVVESLMRERTVLPLRFGTQLRDEDAARALLDERHAQFTRMLDQVRGRVEVGVRVSAREPDDSTRASSGTEYMTQRLEARRQGDQVAATVHEPLARLADRTTTGRSPRAGEVLTASYLLPDDRVGRFTDEVKELQQRHPELALTCTGPWPPYSFVEEAGA